MGWLEKGKCYIVSVNRIAAHFHISGAKAFNQVLVYVLVSQGIALNACQTFENQGMIVIRSFHIGLITPNVPPTDLANTP